MPRERLPNRRPSETRTVEYHGTRFELTIGFRPGPGAPVPAEVFCRSAKPGSDLDQLLDDASVIVSLALQHGADPAAIGRSLGRLHDQPASVLGAIADVLAEVGR